MEKLPEKWCIKTNKDENGKIIGKQFDNQSDNQSDSICYAGNALWYYYHSHNYSMQDILTAGELDRSFAESYIRKGYTEITFEQFKKLVLKQNSMESKSIKINIPEGMEIDKEKSTFKEIVFKAIEKKLPKSWKELEIIKGYIINSDSYIEECVKCSTVESNKNILPTKELAKAVLALEQLLQLRDTYNNGWEVDWCDSTTKYNIVVSENKIEKGCGRYIQYIMAFKTEELRDKFYDNFQDLLEIAKPLL